MLTSGVQNCDRALERMFQCVVYAVGPLPPSRPPDIIHVMNVPRLSPALRQPCIIVNANGGGLGMRLEVAVEVLKFL